MKASKSPDLKASKIIGYVRVSTDKQADEGCSLEAQKARLAQYAALYDIELAETIVDAGVSAKSLDRPGLVKALAMLKVGRADGLLVVKLDRLTRSVRDLGELVSGPFAPGRAALLSVGENIDTRSAGGRLVLNVLASVSQWEREAIGERTSVAMQHMKSEGLFTGGSVPFGFAQVDGLLVQVDAEQAIIAEARALRVEGLSLRAVAAALASRGMVGRTGRTFTPSAVNAMIDRSEGPKAIAA
jgi:DNA invertase Pin-like site-specific DNA recombinase